MEEDGASSRQERFKKLREAQQHQSSKSKIQKVPFMLHGRKHFNKYYEPRAIAISPFHHGKPRCKWAEEFKLLLTSRFIQSNDLEDEDLYNKIEKEIQQLRECYVEEATKNIDDEALAWMLFLDGCSTLQFIHSFIQGELETLFKIKRDQIAFAKQDLFLLENQIPYQVLVLLMSSCNNHNELQQSIEIFVQVYIDPPRVQNQVYIDSPRVQIQQLDETNRMEEVIIMDEEQPIHLLGLLRTRMLGQSKEMYSIQPEEFSQQSFRTVQELTAAGVYFHPSNTNFLGDITFFSKFSGHLSLPPISLSDSTGPKFMNLIAYETCPDFQNNYGVTSYIGFLDALIDHVEDVKKLRLKNVLYNRLGSDEEVAQLFHEIGTDLVCNTDLYCHVKADIEMHCNSVMKKWFSK